MCQPSGWGSLQGIRLFPHIKRVKLIKKEKNKFITTPGPTASGLQAGKVEQTGVFNFSIKGKNKIPAVQIRYTTLHCTIEYRQQNRTSLIKSRASINCLLPKIIEIIFQLNNFKPVHSIETRAPKWLFTIVPKMEGGGGIWGDPAS